MSPTTATTTAPTTATTGATAPDVPTRRISFRDGLGDLPQHFANDDLVTSHFLAAMSALFPDGEDFFVRSVRHYRDRIDDPALRRDVAGFIGQESMHGREHRALNERLAELGYPTRRISRMVRTNLRIRSRIARPISNLALTAALEHFTATLAEQALTDPAAFDLPGDSVVRDLFAWHALEESEHKAVAFDVYRAVGGGERLRIMTMKGARIGFAVVTSLHVVTSLLGDRRTYRRGELRRSWRRFRSGPVLRREVWDVLCEYDRPGFHPDDRDHSELIAYWRSHMFGPDGALNERLIGAA